MEPSAAPLPQIARLAGRLSVCGGRHEVAREVLSALEDVFGIGEAALLRRDADSGRMLVAAGSGSGRHAIGRPFESAVVVTAVNRRAPAAVRLASIDVIALPLLAGGTLRGVLCVQGTDLGGPGTRSFELLSIVAALTGSALAVCDLTGDAAIATAAPLELVYYQADDTVLCDSVYIVKGAPGRILWAMLDAHVRSGRTAFTNRELRLDESLQLPAGRDNLESRLLALRRRLADADCGIALERVARGRLELTVGRRVRMTVVPTGGPMSGAPVPAGVAPAAYSARAQPR